MNDFDKHGLLQEISDTIVDTPNIHAFLNKLPGIIQHYLPFKRTVIYYKSNSGNHYKPYSEDMEPETIPVLNENSPFVQRFITQKGVVAFTGPKDTNREMFENDIASLLEANRINLLFPLYCRHYFRGMLLCHLDLNHAGHLKEFEHMVIGAAHIFIPVIETERMELENDRNYYRLLKFDRLALLGEMVAAVAHELKTPINTILMEIQEMHDILKKDEGMGTACQKIKKEIQRVDQFIGSMLNFSKFEATSMEGLTLNEFVEKTLADIPRKRIPSHLEIDVILENNHQIYTDPNRLRQVFFNILFNAFDAVAISGAVTIRVYSEVPETNKSENRRHIISIRDNGPGIPDEIKDKIMEPFFTTRREGTGLGLYISYGIMRSLKGELVIESSGSGTTVYIVLPGE
ncbi:MAG: sensor histidine kinase [Candidatus Omnitrophota bacterium]